MSISDVCWSLSHARIFRRETRVPGLWSNYPMTLDCHFDSTLLSFFLTIPLSSLSSPSPSSLPHLIHIEWHIQLKKLFHPNHHHLSIWSIDLTILLNLLQHSLLLLLPVFSPLSTWLMTWPLLISSTMVLSCLLCLSREIVPHHLPTRLTNHMTTLHPSFHWHPSTSNDVSSLVLSYDVVLNITSTSRLFNLCTLCHNQLHGHDLLHPFLHFLPKSFETSQLICLNQSKWIQLDSNSSALILPSTKTIRDHWRIGMESES